MFVAELERRLADAERALADVRSLIATDPRLRALRALGRGPLYLGELARAGGVGEADLLLLVDDLITAGAEPMWDGPPHFSHLTLNGRRLYGLRPRHDWRKP